MIESMQRRGLKDFFQINLSCFTTLISIHTEDVIKTLTNMLTYHLMKDSMVFSLFSFKDAQVGA